jgi:hypothetical protein
VLSNPTRCLGGGHHEHRVGTGQCGSDRGRITIIGRRDVCAGQGGRLGGIANHKAVINAELGKSACDPPSKATS